MWKTGKKAEGLSADEAFDFHREVREER